jgi:hypothetical protein
LLSIVVGASACSCWANIPILAGDVMCISKFFVTSDTSYLFYIYYIQQIVYIYYIYIYIIMSIYIYYIYLVGFQPFSLFSPAIPSHHSLPVSSLQRHRLGHRGRHWCASPNDEENLAGSTHFWPPRFGNPLLKEILFLPVKKLWT